MDNTTSNKNDKQNTPKISFNLKSGNNSSENTSFSLKLSKSNNNPNEKKSHAAFGENDDHVNQHNVQLVSGIDLKTGVSIAHPSVESTEHQPDKKDTLIIQPVPNKDWRNEIVRVRRGDATSRHKKSDIYLPQDQSQTENKSDLENLIEQEKKQLTFGLNNGTKATETHTTDQDQIKEITEEISKAELTEDERAREALIKGEPASDLVVPLPQIRPNNYMEDEEEDEELIVQTLTEEEAFKKDISHRPDAPDMEAYQRIPVEEFGAALLRGMGWNGSDNDDSLQKTKRSSLQSGYRNQTSSEIDAAIQRPALLGIGAKPMAAAGIPEMGAWGKGAKPGANGQSKKQDRVYVPLIKINKKSGKPVDEESEEEGKQSTLEKKTKRDRNRNRSSSPNRYDDYTSKKSSRRGKDNDEKEYRDKRSYDDYDRDRRRRSKRDDEDYDREKYHRRKRDYDDDNYDDRKYQSKRSRDDKYRDRDHDRYRDDYERSSSSRSYSKHSDRKSRDWDRKDKDKRR